ncbi:MAG: PKD domain-containing protein, partial [Bacteroidota bacterium]|nr:PKD domain-containing protein [Bacteroidota bacterium]
MKNTLAVFLLLLACTRSFSQTITASFNAPDTVCVNSPVAVQNTSQGATNYFWNFCTANINQPPVGTNLGNVGGLLKTPVYIDYVFTNGNYYAFVTNNAPGGLLRLDFGNSLLNTPVVTNLGNIGGSIANNTEGVQIANDNGNWYVLIVGGDVSDGSIPSLTTVSLGTNIANNTPTAVNWGNIGNLSYPHDLYVFNATGHWYGMTVNYSNNTITLFDLKTSLSNTPTATNLGNIGNLSGPTGIQAINDNGNWRVFVTNATSSTLTRLDFGPSLLNTPTGVNLGNPNNAFTTCWDIFILKYCGENEAFVINANGAYDIVKLDFGSNLLSTPTATSLGNQGNLSFPHSISKLFRVGPDVFSFITNVNNNTLTLLKFPGCTNASLPNSTVQNPPPLTYNTVGTYNINLTVDDGLPTQSSYCKQVVVKDCALQGCNNWLFTPSNPSYVQVGQLNIPGDKITIEATINRTAPYIGGPLYAGDIVSKHDQPSDVNYLLRPNDAEITTSNGYFRTPDICEIELNKTYHVAMVYDGITLKFYRNGFLMSQVAATGNLYQNSWNTRIGFYDHELVNENFIGYINEVRIWNTVRSQNQLQAYMNSSLPNPTTQTGLLAYYTFNDLINKQGNTNWNGTLGGSASINSTNPNCAFVADSCSIPVKVQSIINDYTEVLAFDICKNELTVSDASKYNPGDTVLLIQMKGAVIDSTNTAAFGTVTNYKNAGNYEFNYVKQKNGNVITLKNLVTRQYDIATGKVQLVRAPYYKSLTTTSTLTCLPWDGSKGGVLVFNVQDTLTMNADIDVTGKGFSGGNSPNPHTSQLYCNFNEFYYPVNTPGAAAKGESINIIGSGLSCGKGSPANGGGGGNGHNSGGGGGSNVGQGGLGGYQLDNCGGSTTDNRGIGGKNLLYINASNKIFLGGGGGSGQTDNKGGSDMNGANGGGIVIIKSPVIVNNGSFVINASGADVPNCTLVPTITCHDGNGGGGGGGVVLIEANNIISSTNINISGGKGGDLVFYDVNLGSRIGPGGGGGAGVFWSNNPSLPPNIIVNKTGGKNGVIIPDNNNPYGTTPGQPGQNIFNLKIPVDTILFKPNIDSVAFTSTASSCTSFSFKGQGYTNKAGITKWQWFFGDGATAASQNTSHTYNAMGTYPVKLIVTDVNGCIDSVMRNITTNTASFDFSYTQDVCDPFAVQFFNVGAPPVNPSWSFGDGGVSNAINPVHKFTSPGNYLVKFSIQNGGCVDTVSKTISIGVIPANIILTPDTTICVGSTKQLRTVPSLSFCWTPV